MNENELTGLLESLRRMGSDDLNVEVKESATTLSRDVWETVSAFANTAGGIIVLGVSEQDRKSTRLNSSHSAKSRMPSSA